MDLKQKIFACLQAKDFSVKHPSLARLMIETPDLREAIVAAYLWVCAELAEQYTWFHMADYPEHFLFALNEICRRRRQGRLIRAWFYTRMTDCVDRPLFYEVCWNRVFRFKQYEPIRLVNELLGIKAVRWNSRDLAELTFIFDEGLKPARKKPQKRPKNCVRCRRYR